MRTPPRYRSYLSYPVVSSDYNDSDWNGSDGKPLPQLWDTAGHDIAGLVSSGANGIDVEIITGDDCVTTVANLVHVKPPA